MSITVYLHYEAPGKEEKTLKIVIPKGWTTTKNVSDVIELFAKSYNTKNPDTAIITSEFHLVTNDNEKIHSNIICGSILGDHSDYFIKSGIFIKNTTVSKDSNNKALRCRNYGCQQYYDEEENTDEVCRHHTGPPVFHDTSKYWSCCADKKAYDFESFQAISGCAVGCHSQANPGSSISASPNSTPSAAIGSTATTTSTTAQVKSISDYNAQNPTASTAAASAVKTVTGERKSSRSVDNLSAKCQRKGCQKQFLISNNCDAACVFHDGHPIFHDAVKFWSCCPDKKCYDFDEFLAVPGCKVGLHDDGVIELDA